MVDLVPLLTEAQRQGLLVAVISGGRPKLSQRLTGRFLSDLQGFNDVVWVLSEADAKVYEPDGHAIVTYSPDWAYGYAKDHWMRVEPPECGGFLGAFVGREWACQEAERRGCWGVLQLDDNIQRLQVLRGSTAGKIIAAQNGGLGLFADILSAVNLSTNARVVGAQLSAVIAVEPKHIVRPGFPYSLFVERVGEGREEWYGPYEDDITHSFQYGTRADGVTAGVVPFLGYKKESSSKTGMRAKYDSTRSVQLQRIFPQGADIRVKATRSNGRGEPRVFHNMKNGAIRNPILVEDSALFGTVKDRLLGLSHEWFLLEQELNRQKVKDRLQKHL